MVPLTNIFMKLNHCHFPYPKVAGQFQFNDNIIQSSSECQIMLYIGYNFKSTFLN